MADSQPAKEPNPTAAETAGAAPDAPAKSIFAYSGFNKLFLGSLGGALGDRLYQMALIASANLIFAGTASEDKIGRIQIVATVPQLILYPFAGSLVDKFDRRRLLVCVKGLKIIGVLLLVPLLWKVSGFNPRAPDLQLKDELHRMWAWCLGIVAILSAITVPFAPSRSSAIPDVIPAVQRSLGASLMATCGLVALLLGSMLGSILARPDNQPDSFASHFHLGPAWTVVIASGMYLAATILFSLLPDAVAVPGNKRAGADAQSTAKVTFSEYMAGLIEGVVYCVKRPSLIGLIFFESVFWTLGSAFYILVLFHARTVLELAENDATQFFGLGLGVAGVGLFGGAIVIGKVCHKISPIVSYTPAFVLISMGLYGVFRTLPVTELLPSGALLHSAPPWIYPMMFALGLGGGLILGRVDADVLAIADERVRGRIFSLKGMAFAGTILATILLITEADLSDPQKAAIALWMPRALFMLLPVAFAFSWLVDVAIWGNRGDTQLPGPLHRFGYALLRTVFRLLARVWFRYEVIGVEKIPMTGPVILAANHASFIDPLLLGSSTDRIVQWTMYASYYRSLAHPIFRFLRCIPVDENSTLAALKANIRSLEQGACMGIFPEGHVSDDGRLQPAEAGALFLAQRSGATVVPVAIKGNWEAFPRHAWFARPRKISCIVGEPFTVGKELSRKELAARADQLMADLAKILGVHPPPPPGAGK